MSRLYFYPDPYHFCVHLQELKKHLIQLISRVPGLQAIVFTDRDSVPLIKGSSPVPSQASLNIRKGDLSDRPYTSSAGLKPVASCGTERSGNIVAGRSKKGSRHGCTTFDPTSTESPCGSETGSLHSASHLFLSQASPLVSEASPLGFAPA
ncbi:uncharacterized protein LOC144116191 isoform X2 [Amblyomma americanum]